MKTVSFVIPCYRSERTIRGVADEIRETENMSVDALFREVYRW